MGGRDESTGKEASLMGLGTGWVTVPVELKASLCSHGFWKRGTTATFDILIINLDAVSYLIMTPEQALVKAEK